MLDDAYSPAQFAEVKATLEARLRETEMERRRWEAEADALALDAELGNDSARGRYENSERAQRRCHDDKERIRKALDGAAAKAARYTPRHAAKDQLDTILRQRDAKVEELLYQVKASGLPHDRVPQPTLHQFVAMTTERYVLATALREFFHDSGTYGGHYELGAADHLPGSPVLINRLPRPTLITYEWARALDTLRGVTTDLTLEETKT